MSKTKSPNNMENIAAKPEKQKKLLFHVGLIFGLFYLVVIPVSVFLQVIGNTRTYLNAKREFLTPIMETTAKRLIGDIPNLFWFMDYWRAHPTEIAERVIEHTKDLVVYDEDYSDYFSGSEFTPEDLDSLPEETKLIASTLAYSVFSTEVNFVQWQLNHETILLFSLEQDDPGFIYAIGNSTLFESGDLTTVFSAVTLGAPLWTDDDKPDAVVKLASGESTGPIYERYESSKNDYYFYLGFCPVTEDGQPKYAVCIMHDWTEYHSSLIFNLIILVVISIAVPLTAGAILLYFINSSAIRPLGKVQQAVRSYMQNKNSAEVVEKMSRITQKNEFGALASDVSEMVVEIDRYNEENARLTGERKRVEAELSLATNIQKGVLPTDFPEEPDFKLYASMKPAKEVGGDFYDFFPIDETHYGLAIGDVSGKGVPASLYMMITKLLIKQYARSGDSPSEVLTRTNHTLCEDNRSEMFVTAWFGILDRNTGTIVASNAGHEFPFIRGKDGSFELYHDKHGFVLGGMEMSRYREYEFTLEPGGTLFVYTDGAPEATSLNEELFGTDRMLSSLNAKPDREPMDLCTGLEQDIQDFVGEAPQFDDLTMLCIHYNGKE